MAVTDSHSEFSHRKRRREEENPEALASPEQGSSSKKKKKKKKKKKDKESNEEPQDQVSPKPLLDPSISIVPQKENAEITTQNPHPTTPKKKNKKEVQESSAIPIDLEPNITKAEGPQSDLCPEHEPMATEKKNEVVPTEATVGHPVPDPTPSKDSARKKRRKWNALESRGEEPEPKEQPQLCSPVDTELRNKMKKGVESKEADAEHSRVCLKPELAPPIAKAIAKDSELKQRAELTETKVEHRQACSKPKSAPSVLLATPINPEKKKVAEPGGTLAQHPQPQPCSKPGSETQGDPTMATDQRERKQRSTRGGNGGTCSEEKLENQGSQAIPTCAAIPTDSKQNMSNRKWETKRMSAFKSEGTGPNEHNSKTPETPVLRSICPIAAPSIDPTIPKGPAPPIVRAPSIAEGWIVIQPKKKKKKEKKKIVVIIEEAEPNERCGKPRETPVQKSICHIAAPSTDLTIPAGQAPRVDPAQKTTKEKREMKGKSALKSEGSVSKKHNAYPTAETSAQRTEGSTLTKVGFEWFGENTMRCWACRQHGHRFEKCPRLKRLSKDEEVCFFCGEIGHSLGKCSVSRAGGGRFAKCLFCYKHGHFSYNCPQNGLGIDPKVVATNESINKSTNNSKDPLQGIGCLMTRESAKRMKDFASLVMEKWKPKEGP